MKTCSNCYYFKKEEDRDDFKDCHRGCPVYIIEKSKDGKCHLWRAGFLKKEKRA
jgi:hypothetical protein